jgi:hypothetical protein
MNDRESRIINVIHKHRQFGSEAVAIMLAGTDVQMEEIPQLCLDIGMRRETILQIGVALAKTGNDYRTLGRAFRSVFSGMSGPVLVRLFERNIPKKKFLAAALQGANEAQAA